MILDIPVLTAIKKLGVATYSQLEAETKEKLNKLRWCCNDLKARQLVKQTEDPTDNEVAWKITAKGDQHLFAQQQSDIEAAELEKHKAKHLKKPGKATPAKAAKGHVGRACATPAAGGAYISRSTESDRLVEADSTSTEARAVVETQAAGLAAEESALASAYRPAVSDVKSDIEIIADQLFQVSEDEPPIEFADPQLFAMISIDGTMHIAFAWKEINLPAFAVRELADFIGDTEAAWD
ncbi:MAG: hypothetical protein H6R14_798 [Proteobacteria bacterium]|nr:hypothetical protein [Pseudomonadota bacterium]